MPVPATSPRLCLTKCGVRRFIAAFHAFSGSKPSKATMNRRTPRVVRQSHSPPKQFPVWMNFVHKRLVLTVRLVARRRILVVVLFRHIQPYQIGILVCDRMSFAYIQTNTGSGDWVRMFIKFQVLLFCILDGLEARESDHV